MGLRQLDDELVPRLAERAQAARDTLAASPSPGEALRGLDEHYASTGVLRVVRDAPLLGLLLAGAVLLTSTGVGVALSRGQAWSTTVAAAPPPLLGAPVGADADAHLASEGERTVQAARETPGTRRLALVSLRDQLDVTRTTGLVAGSQLAVRRVYVRAPAPELAEVFPVDTAADPARTLAAFLTETARRKAEESRELVDLARSESAPPQAEADAGESYAELARTAGQEAAAYGADCACVLAVVLEGPASELAELLSVPAVRGVELAPRGARLSRLEVVPLPPGVTGPVPAAGPGQ